MRLFSKVLLTTGTALAISTAAATAAGAAPQPVDTAASGLHLNVKLGGLQGEVYVGDCVYESLTGRLLQLEQDLSLGC